MSLALETKKFINSQYVGSYVDITAYYADPSAAKAAAAAEAAAAPVETAPAAEEDVPPAQPDDATPAAGEAPTEGAPLEAAVRGEETVRLHYVDEGEGEPVLLVHAPGQSLYTWRALFPELAKRFRVIALDMPGHGYSSRLQHVGYTIPEMADVLVAFMERLGIVGANVVGFSMASAYVLEAAAKAPERFSRIAVINPGGVTAGMPLSIRMLETPLFGFVSATLFNMRTLNKCLSSCLFDLTVLTPDVEEQYYATLADSASRRAVRHCFAQFYEEDLLLKLREVETFTLVLHSTEDKWHTSEHAELYHAGLRNAVRAEIRNAGHLVHEEKPVRVAETLTTFFPGGAQAED
ncbi:MAG: alpha/beta hydrolase [Clostridia bacterium]|nr:alpha/beta hydrolase [Clostridia bacterium]